MARRRRVVRWVVEVLPGAAQGRFEFRGLAARGIVRELRAVDVDADVAQVERDPGEDVGNRVRRARVDS